MDLRHQLGIVRKWFPLLVACVVIAAAAAFALSSIQQRIYQARATLIVGQSLQALNPDFNQLMVSQRLSSTYAAVATKRPALNIVIEQLGLEQTPDQLAKKVWAETPTDSSLLNLTAQDPDPARAAAIANALADQLIAASPGNPGSTVGIPAVHRRRSQGDAGADPGNAGANRAPGRAGESGTRRHRRPGGPAGSDRDPAIDIRVAALALRRERRESPQHRRARRRARGAGVAHDAAQHPPGRGGRSPPRGGDRRHRRVPRRPGQGPRRRPGGRRSRARSAPWPG